VRLSHIVQKYQDIDKMTVLTCHAMMSNEQARDAPMTMSCCIVNFKISNTQKETKKTSCHDENSAFISVSTTLVEPNSLGVHAIFHE
jgi:hypothetical protein